ncbi:MAG: GYD domain-containing protein [Desulfurococcales archaeon]|nr:GYD domain-containing protein [Desulfurococcales archaeon]
MPYFAVFSKLTDDGAKTILRNPERIKEVNREIEEKGVKVIAQYVILGDYDFLNIVEAPDETTLLRVLVDLNSRGTIRTSTYRLIPVDEFISAMKGE